MKKKEKDLLTWYIRELLHLEKDIIIVSDGGLIHLEVKGVDFNIYIKSLTYAGNPYPQNTTRAQLPKRDEFESIKRSDSIFLFLGYDEANEVFACWDPNKTKNRLNDKQYVSFFSRLNLQESVRIGEVLKATLTNGDKYVLFKQNDLAKFLLNICDYFPDLKMPVANIAISDKVQGVLAKIEDDSSVKLLIDEMLAHDPDISSLSLLSRCMNEFGEFYHKMTLKDWHHAINDYLSSHKTLNELINEDEWEDSAHYAAEPFRDPEN